MTKAEIITKFRLFMDDMTELSSEEESNLFDKMYRKVNSARPWEGTKKQGTATTSTTVPYVSLASDFLFLTQNANYTDSSELASRPVVFRGTSYVPYEVVSWSDRRQYRESNKAYIDIANSRLYFTQQPTVAESVEYDYHSAMPALANDESPWFPEEYHDVLYHLMVADDFMIQHSDKAKSYRSENMKAADEYLNDMTFWNSQLIQI
jgi:hypothetical protein